MLATISDFLYRSDDVHVINSGKYLFPCRNQDGMGLFLSIFSSTLSNNDVNLVNV